MDIEHMSREEREELKNQLYNDTIRFNSRSDNRHYGPVEDLSKERIRGLEDMARYQNVKMNSRPDNRHYGPVEDMDDVSFLESAVKRQREEDQPAIDYFRELNKSPKIEDAEQFKNAVGRSIQSNRIINKFMTEYKETLDSKITAFRNADANDKEGLDAAKHDIEDRPAIYSHFMYELKSQRAVVDPDSVKMPDYIKEDLWQAQRSKDVTFGMPIPSTYKGHKPFEVTGDAVSVINCLNGVTKTFQGRIINDKPTQELGE